MNNADHIERLREEIDAGESSLDVPMKVMGILGKIPLAMQFATAYEEYAENETPIDSELIEHVCEAMAAAPEYDDPFLNRNHGINL